MRLKRSSNSPDPTVGIAQFWSWWNQYRTTIEAAVDAKQTDVYEALLTEAVQRIHPDLQWELGGAAGDRRLVVTAAGKPLLLSTAARWAADAPASEVGWSFFRSRQPDLNALGQTLVHGDTKVNLSEATVTIHEDSDSQRIHGEVRHPAFAAVEAGQRLSMAYLILDWALGEDDVARWIGEVTTSVDTLDGAIPIAGLPALVAGFATSHPSGGYALLRGTGPGNLPLTAIVAMPLHRVDHPLFDQHVMISVPYTTMNGHRMQIGVSAERLTMFDDALGEIIGDAAVLAVAASHNGRRTFHLYCDPQGTVADKIKGWKHGWPEGKVVIETSLDPGWQAIRTYQP